MPTGLKRGDKLATFNIPLEKWERFKEKAGKGNAAKTLNAMITAYLEGAIDVNNWTTTEPINGAAHEWTRELESRLDWKIKSAIADLDAKYTDRFLDVELNVNNLARDELESQFDIDSIKTHLIADLSEKQNSRFVDLEGAVTFLKTDTKLQSELIETIQKEIVRNKWMINKYAEVLMEIEQLRIAVTTLQEETAEYMKGF